MRRILLLAVATLSMAWTRAEDVSAPTGGGVVVRSPDHVGLCAMTSQR